MENSMENMHTDVRVQKVKQRFKQNTQQYTILPWQDK